MMDLGSLKSAWKSATAVGNADTRISSNNRVSWVAGLPKGIPQVSLR